MGVMSPEQLYFMYYQTPYYQAKNDNYMNYSNIPMQSMSPSKSNSYKVGTNIQSVPNYFSNPNYTQGVSSPSTEIN